MIASQGSIYACILPAAFLLAALDASTATIDVAKVSEVKAAYVRNIAAMTTWPEEKLGDPGRPMVVGVLGADPNGVVRSMRMRMGTGAGLLAQGRRLDLLAMDTLITADPEATIAALQRCDLLFLSEDGREQWQRIKSVVSEMPIVTLGEIEQFAELGGMIEYVIDLDAGRIRLIVNRDAVGRAGIVLSARLLRLKSVTVIRDTGIAQ